MFWIAVAHTGRELPPNIEEPLFWRLWEALLEALSAELGQPSAQKVLRYASLQAEHHWAEHSHGTVREDGRFGVFFSDEQGNANVYCQLMPHWLELILALRYDAIVSAFDNPCYTITSPRPELQAILDRATAEPFAVAGGYHCQVASDRIEPRGWAYLNDLSGPPEEALSAQALAHLQQVVDSGRCACDFCVALR